MPQPLDTRLHPIVALRAVRALLQDPEDTPQVFLLLDALRGRTSQRQLARFQQTEVGRTVLAERRRLFDRLNNRDALAALPAGTLGRLYFEFTAAEHFTAQGLAGLPLSPVSIVVSRSQPAFSKPSMTAKVPASSKLWARQSRRISRMLISSR